MFSKTTTTVGIKDNKILTELLNYDDKVMVMENKKKF